MTKLIGLNEKVPSIKNDYKRSRTVIILLSVSIPFATGFIKDTDFGLVIKILVGVAGVIIALLEGLTSLHKHQENWVQYRTYAETLKQEKLLYLTKAGKYFDAEDPFHQFVNNIESILSKENQVWSQYITKKSEAKMK
ncbi:MAG: DUF4231 domain-containing protein [Saprospiraceae bacterium]|nr:DUF4231 domain-containing protein [Saprospiraceae bacterium]